MAAQLRATHITDGIYNLVMIYLHDLPRGQAPANLHPADKDSDNHEPQTDADMPEKKKKKTWADIGGNGDINVVPEAMATARANDMEHVGIAGSWATRAENVLNW